MKINTIIPVLFTDAAVPLQPKFIPSGGGWAAIINYNFFNDPSVWISLGAIQISGFNAFIVGFRIVNVGSIPVSFKFGGRTYIVNPNVESYMQVNSGQDGIKIFANRGASMTVEVFASEMTIQSPVYQKGLGNG